MIHAGETVESKINIILNLFGREWKKKITLTEVQLKTTSAWAMS